MFLYKPKFHLSWFFQPKIAKVMAGAPNPDLFDFINSLEREEKYSTDTAAAPNNINIDDTISDSSSITSNGDLNLPMYGKILDSKNIGCRK